MPSDLETSGRLRHSRVLFAIAILLFQSHWLDDVGSGASDQAGIAVSAIGSVLVAAGGWWRRHLLGRLGLGMGLLFMILVSVADLTGIRPDGSMAPDLLGHLKSELGVGLSVAVALNLVCAVALVGRELQRSRRAPA